MSNAEETAPNPEDAQQGDRKPAVIPRPNLLPWILITVCFALWGFANDITNPMVKAFSKILLMSNFEGALVQTAFYGGYFVMAIPAAIFIKKTSYKSGVLVGLGLYAVGGLMFVPASWLMTFWPFLLAYFIITCGLSFLETSCNPYILAMGPEETATQRLNFSQAFNPIGSLVGMFTASKVILARLEAAAQSERANMGAEELAQVTYHDLSIIREPYVAIALISLTLLLIIGAVAMPRPKDKYEGLDLAGTFRRLFKNKRYIEGVVAQFFYVGAQIMCWTFIIHYGAEVFTTEPFNLSEKQAEITAFNLNIAAMVLFVTSRFICTYLLRVFRPGAMLAAFAAGGLVLTFGTIFIQGVVGLACLVGVSGCMSLMFPTIYGIALKGLGDDAKLGAAGLIMAILGGSVLPPVQGWITDFGSVNLGVLTLPAVNASFVLPAICFIVVGLYGLRTNWLHED